jgi:hypothetical protein
MGGLTMRTITYKGVTHAYRTFEVASPYKLLQYNIAKESFEKSLDLENDEDLEIDGEFYFYVSDEDFDLPAKELFDIIRQSDDYYTFVREV